MYNIGICHIDVQMSFMECGFRFEGNECIVAVAAISGGKDRVAA